MSENNKKNTLVVGLISGPGVGKSTIMSDIFSSLKWAGIDCEMAPEFAKELVWDSHLEALKDQLYLFGEQSHRQVRVNGKVDVVITDSPLILFLMYASNKSEAFKTVIMEEFNSYNNMMFFLHRSKPYNPNGRTQTEEQAKELDIIMRDLLISHNVPFEDILATPENVNTIVNKIIKTINN